MSVAKLLDQLFGHGYVRALPARHDYDVCDSDKLGTSVDLNAEATKRAKRPRLDRGGGEPIPVRSQLGPWQVKHLSRNRELECAKSVVSKRDHEWTF